MARQNNHRDTSPILSAAQRWIDGCLIGNGSLFSNDAQLWTGALLEEVFHAFVEHPDTGADDFITKLKRQVSPASHPAQHLAAELLWALLLFPSNVKARTKRQQIAELWNLSGKPLTPDSLLLSDEPLGGIGSGGPGFNNYRPEELEYLIALCRALKTHPEGERRKILTSYEAFFEWIGSVPRKGSRQYRHMLRYFAFPDLVERISSNNDRRRILRAFQAGSPREVSSWKDRELDEKLLQLRRSIEAANPSVIVDFYEAPWNERWSGDRKIKTGEGEVAVTVPVDDDEEDAEPIAQIQAAPELRQSIQIQAKLARIGAVMGFRVWLPRSDRARVTSLLETREKATIVEDLPLNYDSTTIDTIEQIDVLWLKGRSIVRAFEVEHTTAVYSGLLRMADLLALQPNMDIRLHIVAPDERREKVMREMKRPVFSLLDRGPLSEVCTFISYESVEAVNALEHLAHTNDSVIAEYEQRAD